MIVDYNDPRTCGSCEHQFHRTTDENGYCLLNGCKVHGSVGGSDGKNYRCGDWKRGSWFTEESWKAHVDNCCSWAKRLIEMRFRMEEEL